MQVGLLLKKVGNNMGTRIVHWGPLVTLLVGFMATLMGFSAVAKAQDLPTPAVCEFGESRGRRCYLGEQTFCSGVKLSKLFPGYIECGADPKYCYDTCSPAIVEQGGKIRIHSTARLKSIGNGLVVAKTVKGTSSLYDSKADVLIRSGTYFWGCRDISLVDDQTVLCVREKGAEEILNVSDLRAFRKQIYEWSDVVARSHLDLCAVTSVQGQGPFQFWANRFRVGHVKYPIHVVNEPNNVKYCQFQTMSGPKCTRILVDEKGVVCRNKNGDQRILNLELSLGMRTANFRDWLKLGESSKATSFAIEELEDDAIIQVVDRQGLLKLRK